MPDRPVDFLQFQVKAYALCARAIGQWEGMLAVRRIVSMEPSGPQAALSQLMEELLEREYLTTLEELKQCLNSRQ